MRDKLIKAGVSNLKEFGYPLADELNILTDEVYSAFFLSILEDNFGFSREVDEEITKLIDEIFEG